ncbi:WD40 repeat-like protein, partial [Thozetella sp. PMI_491]
RRWDDPPELEPDAPAENPTTLILVHARRVQTFATRREVIRLEFSPNDRFVAACTAFSPLHQHADDYMTLSFYETKTWANWTLTAPNPVRVTGDFAISPGQTVVATPYYTMADTVPNPGSKKPHLDLYDLVTRKKLGKGDPIVPIQAPLAFSPDGRLLAAASSRDPSRIMIVDVSQQPVQTTRIIATHISEVTQLGWAPDGTAVISASKDGSLRMTSTATGRTLRKFEVPPTRFNCSMMRVAPDGEVVVSIWGREVHLWYPRTGGISGYNLDAVRAAEGWPLAISPDCKFLLCRTEVGFDVSDVGTGRFRGDFVAESTLVTTAAFSSDSRYVVVGKYTGEVHLFEVVTS